MYLQYLRSMYTSPGFDQSPHHIQQSLWSSKSDWRASGAGTRPSTTLSLHTRGEFGRHDHPSNYPYPRDDRPIDRALDTRYRTARNSKPLEVIGTYDPVPKPDPYDKSGRMHKDIKLDTTRARYWIGVGAQPSDTVWRLLSMVGERCLGRFYDEQGRVLTDLLSQLGIMEPKYRNTEPRTPPALPLEALPQQGSH